VTLGIPVLTGPDADAARAAAGALLNGTPTTCGDDRGPDGASAPGVASERPVAVGGCGLGSEFSIATALSGCEVPGIGFIDADTVEALLDVVPLEVGRALLDARTGTVVETMSAAYKPPRAIADFVKTRDGTCRMWGCTRPARSCDTDHARPWPAGSTTPRNLGALCRRHHRLKQRRRWAHELHPDGSVTWTSPRGRRRTTLPDHMIWPPASPDPHQGATPPKEPQRDPIEPPPF
jgi:hypothetical protein